MNMNDGQTQETTLETTQSTNPLQRTLPFNFRKTKPEALAEQLSVNLEDISKPEFLAQFDMLDKDENIVEEFSSAKWLKRKTVTETVELPEFVLDAPEADQKYLADILENTFQSYIKVNYIDSFEEVKHKDWESIKKWLDSKGSRSAKWDFSKETGEEAAKAFGAYISETTGIAEVGKRLDATAKGRFSRNAIQRHVNDFSEETLHKLQNKIDEFMHYLSEQDAESFDEYAPVYDCWTDALKRHLEKQEKPIDIASVL